MTLGQRINRLRTQAGLSQEELAARTGVSRQSVSKWETDASVPELDKLIQLANLFRTTLDALVQGSQEPASPEPPPAPVPAAPVRNANTRLIAGGILLAAGLLGLFLSVFIGRLSGVFLLPLALSVYLSACGLLCLTVRKHLGLAVVIMTCLFLVALFFIILSSYMVTRSFEEAITSMD